jgi:hypothetical protein
MNDVSKLNFGILGVLLQFGVGIPPGFSQVNETWSVSSVVALHHEDDSDAGRLLWLGVQNRSE